MYAPVSAILFKCLWLVVAVTPAYRPLPVLDLFASFSQTPLQGVKYTYNVYIMCVQFRAARSHCDPSDFACFYVEPYLQRWNCRLRVMGVISIHWPPPDTKHFQQGGKALLQGRIRRGTVFPYATVLYLLSRRSRSPFCAKVYIAVSQ